MARRPPPVQLGLFEWQAPPSYPPEAIRAASLQGRISRAVAHTLKECGRSRAEIAARMGTFLGSHVSQAMLNAYASQAREEHAISAVRLVALADATGDARLLDVLAEPLGLAVIPRKLLPLIELAEVHEQSEALRRKADALRRTVRS